MDNTLGGDGELPADDKRGPPQVPLGTPTALAARARVLGSKNPLGGDNPPIPLLGGDDTVTGGCRVPAAGFPGAAPLGPAAPGAAPNP